MTTPVRRGVARPVAGGQQGRPQGGGGRPVVQRAAPASTFVYQERSAESVKQRAEQTGGRFDTPLRGNINMYRAKEGTNIIRFLPPTWPNADHYAYSLWMHEYIGAESGGYLCLQKMLGQPCPICQAEREARAQGDTEEANQLKAREKRVAWVLDRNDEKATEPKAFLMSWSMDRDITALCINRKNGEILWIDHHEVGFDLAFQRAGKQLNTRYFGYQIDRESSPVDPDPRRMAQILDFVTQNPLPDVLVYKDPAYLESVLYGTAGEVDELDQTQEEGQAEGEYGQPYETQDLPTPQRRAFNGRAAPQYADQDDGEGDYVEEDSGEVVEETVEEGAEYVEGEEDQYVEGEEGTEEGEDVPFDTTDDLPAGEELPPEEPPEERRPMRVRSQTAVPPQRQPARGAPPQRQQPPTRTAPSQARQPVQSRPAPQQPTRTAPPQTRQPAPTRTAPPRQPAPTRTAPPQASRTQPPRAGGAPQRPVTRPAPRR